MIDPGLIDETDYIRDRSPDFAFQDYLNRKLAVNFESLSTEEFDYLLSQVTTPASNKYADPAPHYIIEHIYPSDESMTRVIQLLSSEAYRGLLLHMDYTNARGETIFAVLLRRLVQHPRLMNEYAHAITQSFPEVRNVEIEFEGHIHTLV